jgi:hypothetical protein
VTALDAAIKTYPIILTVDFMLPNGQKLSYGG